MNVDGEGVSDDFVVPCELQTSGALNGDAERKSRVLVRPYGRDV